MAVRLISLLFCLLLYSAGVWGQKTCGTTQYQDIQKLGTQTETKESFENWMSIKLKERLLSRQITRTAKPTEVVTIPVVVHIIHNGEASGVGANIEDSRVLEQIARLNLDFRRLNSDTVNTPPEFLGVAADTEIEFVLAQRDPHGLPTTGIIRVLGSRPVFDLVHNTELKALSYWPSEDYMNIWVAQLDNILGYAQFPVSSSLPGLEIASENRLTDGVVIDTDFFGINAGISPESIGRTATHEVGHFLGLRHTWGDGGCSVDDFCDDTPRSNNSNFGCPDASSCGSDDMVENYMDLTDDLCMNLFTICQKNRMQVVMENSPRRATLLTSKGATPPVMVDNDAGIREITIPKTNTCAATVTPLAEIQNTGTNTISSFTVELRLDGNTAQSKTINSTLEMLESTSISFNSVEVFDMTEIEVLITEANGVPDGNAENNSKKLTLEAKSFISLPVTEAFNTIPDDWEIRNDDNSLTWQVTDAPAEDLDNKAISVNFFNYSNSDGEYDYLITPAFDLSTYTGLILEFDMAYAPFSPGDQDGLIVAISNDCGNDFPMEQYVYFKQGIEMATAPPSAGSFVPSGRNQWRTEQINLDQYAGSSHLKVAFIAINDFGNNLYLDNVNISGTRVPEIDLGVEAILQPSVVLCSEPVEPQIVVKNTGLNTISNFQIAYTLQSGAQQQVAYQGPPLALGETASLTFDAITIAPGSNIITATIVEVEGQGGDGRPENNLLTLPFLVDNESEPVPLVERFEQFPQASSWNPLSLDDDISWTATDAPGISEPGNQAAFLNFFSYSDRGQIDYLASPVLDFTNARNPSMTFDLAYAGNPNFHDGLVILGSDDCGLHYRDTLFQASGGDLATVISGTNFVPSDSSDWKLYQIDLTRYAGQSAVRLAFAGINDFGNNLYIDNIQFFLSDVTKSIDLDTDQMIVFPNPSQGDLNVTFNLAQRTDIHMRIVDAMGRVIWDRELPNVLNQTFELESLEAGGIYYVQVTSSSFTATSRIIIL
jgi:hypothetical protein